MVGEIIFRNNLIILCSSDNTLFMNYSDEKQVKLLEEMEALKHQMISLSLQKKQMADEHKLKSTTIAPNMKAMSDWLENTQQLKEYYKLSDSEKHHHILDKVSSRGPVVDVTSPENIQLTEISNKLKNTKICEPRRNGLIVSRDQDIIAVPSEFMINFVESTFNMFNQLHERIKILESTRDEVNLTLTELDIV